MRVGGSWNSLGTLLLCAIAASTSALAEEARFPVERFRPAIDGNGLIDVDSGDVGDHLDWSAGAFVNYALNPLVLRNDTQRVGALVAHRVGLDVVGAVSLFDWIEVGVDAPMLVFQARDTNEVKDAVLGADDLSAIGIGDLRVLTKVRILRHRDQLVDLALIPAITIPTGFAGFDTGSREGNYVGEGQITFAPELAVSRAFNGRGPLQGLRLAANVGYRLRPEERKVVNVTIGHELTYRAGVGYRLAVDTPIQVDVTANGGTYAFQPFTSGFEENPLEVLAAVNWDPVPSLRLTGGVGKGILSGFGTPDFRAFVGVRFVPVSEDRDHDGILNDEDTCPDDPEDKDDFEDADGCPDLDNDKDGVNDVDDGCVMVPEDPDGFEDTDGCPDPDNDKDGFLDEVDECPLVPGPDKGCPSKDRDGDGILNEEDMCPDNAGPVATKGCPDSDGDGVRDIDDRCPDEPGPIPLAGCPDRDKDGLRDLDDLCPDLAGLIHQKGCPDTDGDGFIDPEDKCPKEPEIVNNFEDEDGCPDKGKTSVKVTKEKIEITDKVYFDTGKDTIQARSFPLLDQVATVMRNHPEMTKARVEGHTDSDGSDETNLDLSDRRAKAVKRYLVGKGIEADRLQAVGYGERREVVPNTSKSNKEKNRRVEFVIVEIDDKPVEAPLTR
ncbi:MAG: OmpA family protein [Deltaproteobacteria bacterium]|nr:OmpA family protein [Deltaproteobacteria bacterium]